jgi:MFS family permease
MPEFHDPYAALRSRDYRFFLTGSILASVGTEMQSAAVGWELFQRTESAAALGYVGLVQFLPVLLLSLPAGQAADRYSRKGLLLAAQVTVSLASLGLAVLSFLEGPIPLVYACLLITGLSQALRAPVRWSLLPQLVPEAALNNAVTWYSSGWQLSSLGGPTLAGLVIAAAGGATAAYLVGALCSLACAVLVIPLRPRPTFRREEPFSLRSLLAGVRFIYKTKVILATITLDLFAVLLGGATALLPIFARDILHVGSVGYGFLRAAPSLGALVMAMVLAHRPPLRRAGPTLLLAVAGFGAATIGFGLSENVVLSFVMLALTGALDNVSVVVRGTLVQGLTPDPMRGRVSAVNAIFIGSSNELGAFESGITAYIFGPIASVVGGGIGTLLVVVAVGMTWPQVLRLGSLVIHEPPGPAEAEARAEEAFVRGEHVPPAG